MTALTAYMLPLMEVEADTDTKTAAKRTAARKLRIKLAPHVTQLPSVKTGMSSKQSIVGNLSACHCGYH